MDPEEVTAYLNTVVGQHFEIQTIVGQPDGVYGWKLVRKIASGGTLIGPDLLPAALIKKDFKGIRIMNNVPDVVEELKRLVDAIHKKYSVSLEIPKE